MDARDEFDDFVRARWRPLPRAATLLTGDVQAAENLGRETPSGAARRWAVVSAAGSPEAYVRRILDTRSIDAGRWRRHQPNPL